MRSLVAVLVSVLMTSAAFAEGPILVINNRVGWLTKFDSLSFSTSSSWEDADPKKRGSLDEGMVTFSCDERGEYGIVWSFKNKFEPTKTIKRTKQTVLVSGGSSMALRHLSMLVTTGVDSDPSSLSTFAYTSLPRFDDDALSIDEFLSVIRDFYDARSISIQLVGKPKVKLSLAVGVGESDLHPSERSKEALSLAYSVCKSFLRR